MTANYKKSDSDTRPWGTWEVLDAGDTYAVKKITVLPEKILSLQSHNHRDEHWIIVCGTAKVRIGDKTVVANANTPFFIPAKTLHRIENAGKTPMVFIEVQTGELLDENDIIRYEDAYGRV
ncbi:mannose-1-phosphate guanylyltransferase/mannose-6-phosphate isomerase [Acetobacter sp. CAG:977]|nr:mannose-1-phosphate guanylyltransferase/mannose-6-phosphate isomerase [Acetobacter sp. CAG:977]